MAKEGGPCRQLSGIVALLLIAAGPVDLHNLYAPHHQYAVADEVLVYPALITDLPPDDEHNTTHVK
eukprot:1985302-Rhodomonas_salina.1